MKRTARWLKIKLFEWKKFIESIRYLGLFSPLVKIRANQLIASTFVYPLAKLITQDSQKSHAICESFINIPLKPGVLSFPASLSNNKVIVGKNQHWSVITEIYINDSYDKKTIQEEMTVIDVGAHIGAYATLSAEKVGAKGKVIAIEPEEQNYQLLQENIKINNFANITPVKKALSDRHGFEKLYLSHSSACHTLIPNNNEVPSTVVPVTTLDALLAELDITRIDIIKVDVEGAEIAVLRGALKTLENNPDVKVIVASYHYPGEVKEIQDFLEKMGFKTAVSYCDIVSTI